MGSPVLHEAAAHHRESAMGLRPGVQNRRQNVCRGGAGARAGLYVVQVLAGGFRGVDGAPRRDPGSLLSARPVGGAGKPGRPAGGGDQETAKEIVRPGAGQTSRKDAGDRKSTRLNSSHLGISYAVFCLKKKKNTT